MTYWLNVDFLTSTARVHRSDCPRGVPKIKTASDGYWRGFPTLDEARLAAGDAMMECTTLCRRCLRNITA